jgi:hypothetical protein
MIFTLMGTTTLVMVHWYRCTNLPKFSTLQSLKTHFFAKTTYSRCFLYTTVPTLLLSQNTQDLASLVSRLRVSEYSRVSGILYPFDLLHPLWSSILLRFSASLSDGIREDTKHCHFVKHFMKFLYVNIFSNTIYNAFLRTEVGKYFVGFRFQLVFDSGFCTDFCSDHFHFKFPRKSIS